MNFVTVTMWARSVFLQCSYTFCLLFLGLYYAKHIYRFYFLNHSNEEYLGYFNQTGFI